LSPHGRTIPPSDAAQHLAGFGAYDAVLGEGAAGEGDEGDGAEDGGQDAVGDGDEVLEDPPRRDR
jgi:hypothetical protein